MNISKPEQRVLHALAQGGNILYERGSGNKIASVLCVTRDGHFLTDCTVEVVLRLRRKRLIESFGGRPYRISQKGRLNVRAQFDNR